MIVDAQVHIWRGVAPGTDPRQLARHGAAASFGIADIIRQLDTAGVRAAVLVPPGWALDRGEAAIAAARQLPGRFAAVGRLDPVAPGAGPALAAWNGTPVLGFRLVFSGTAVALRLRRGELDHLFARAAMSRCPLTISVPGSIPAVRRIARCWPWLTLVIDHLGLPAGISPVDVEAAVGELCQLAILPNVAVKATSLPSYSALAFPHSDIQIQLMRVIDAFGPDRVFWASDLTKHLGRYRRVLAVVQRAVSSLPTAEQALVLGEAICTWFGWRPHGDI